MQQRRLRRRRQPILRDDDDDDQVREQVRWAETLKSSGPRSNNSRILRDTETDDDALAASVVAARVTRWQVGKKFGSGGIWTRV